ncbi:stage II sporulation protein R [Cytobacillus sp. IB215665]|uniref:stage II sporulation protein R n=1 Tax=Cytobacillus sp. IB215665 TaxID=3097357 RepID=UPI002A14B652|nr:stage II sporulation protein R [Cytobacillus sp. IB215665]MDX8363679.1 stage II sporulation protein R [Cytobacillus sp. IB215665]
MGKKNIAIIYILLLVFGVNIVFYGEQTNVQANDTVIIPDEAIRLRILANSDSSEDQALKRLIRDKVNEQITQWVEELTSIEEARKLINTRVHMIEQIVESVLSNQGSKQIASVDFGEVSFPTKLYGNYLYPAGEYEAILITLGDGAGANWWCVLFPPLCFLDFSNGEAVDMNDNSGNELKQMKEKQDEKVKVRFFLIEWLSKLFD